jgi:hypothetical protein
MFEHPIDHIALPAKDSLEASSGGTIAHPGDLKAARHARCASLEPRGGARCAH